MTSFHEKAHGSFISNYIKLKLGLIVLQVNVHQLTEWILSDVTVSRWRS